jgi:hypothetical protein
MLTVKCHFSFSKSTALQTYLHFTVVFLHKKVLNQIFCFNFRRPVYLLFKCAYKTLFKHGVLKCNLLLLVVSLRVLPPWIFFPSHFCCNEIYKATVLKSNLDLYFKTTILSFIVFETRKQSFIRLLSTQPTSAYRTIPHSWNTSNLREWHDLKNSLAIILPLYMLPILVVELTH